MFHKWGTVPYQIVPNHNLNGCLLEPLRWAGLRPSCILVVIHHRQAFLPLKPFPLDYRGP